MDVRRIADGLWYWTAPHPNWRNWSRGPSEPKDVGCVYYEAEDAVTLIDPLIPAGNEKQFMGQLDTDIERLGLPVVILLSCAWHKRSADELTERYGARIGGQLPAGIDEIPIRGADERQVAYFFRPHHALYVAEIFGVDLDGKLWIVPSPALERPDELDASLAEIQGLPVERLLVSHGDPIFADARRRMAIAPTWRH
jgi:hypothetical protein